MRVPDLGWRSDLFEDAVAAADSPIINQTARANADDQLWSALRRAWTSGETAMTGRQSPCPRLSPSILQISAARNAINVQRS